MNIYYQICLQVKTSRRISTGDQTKKGLFIDTFSGLCTDILLLSKQPSGCISCLPYLQSMLFVLGCVSSWHSPPPHPFTHPELNKEWQRRDAATWSQDLALELKGKTNLTWGQLTDIWGFQGLQTPPWEFFVYDCCWEVCEEKKTQGYFVFIIDRELILACKWSRKKSRSRKGITLRDL